MQYTLYSDYLGSPSQADKCTVEPLYSGHNRDPAGCPVWRGVPNSDVYLYTALYTYVVGTANSVLIRGVPLY